MNNYLYYMNIEIKFKLDKHLRSKLEKFSKSVIKSMFYKCVIIEWE